MKSKLPKSRVSVCALSLSLFQGCSQPTRDRLGAEDIEVIPAGGAGHGTKETGQPAEPKHKKEWALTIL